MKAKKAEAKKQKEKENAEREKNQNDEDEEDAKDGNRWNAGEEVEKKESRKPRSKILTDEFKKRAVRRDVCLRVATMTCNLLVSIKS